MSDEIRPTETGDCSGDDCPSYDGKRCLLTGFRPSACEPGWGNLRAALQAAEAERIETRDRCFALVAERDAAEARAAAAERDLKTERSDNLAMALINSGLVERAAAAEDALRELLGTLVGEDVPDSRLSAVELRARRALRGSPGSDR